MLFGLVVGGSIDLGLGLLELVSEFIQTLGGSLLVNSGIGFIQAAGDEFSLQRISCLIAGREDGQGYFFEGALGGVNRVTGERIPGSKN